MLGKRIARLPLPRDDLHFDGHRNPHSESPGWDRGLDGEAGHWPGGGLLAPAVQILNAIGRGSFRETGRGRSKTSAAFGCRRAGTAGHPLVFLSSDRRRPAGRFSLRAVNDFSIP